MKKTCPFCGSNTLEQKRGEYRFEPPENIPGGELVVPNATWWECASCGEHMIPRKLDVALQQLAAKAHALYLQGEIYDE